ncbi:hypothetical protein THASP1DRAFT_27587 [Thamnocephalis sphaerospora]|uniref:Uncharacterized protein n=1 Tax=Thamnocephalis sphaerospora TaxID=78915 RepID=A0A4V1IXC9_9FUNG|nr:hypothetical protein THASP1DRAFT_27587 [Thamnocephalis sphaerospora]|eukprot:RKP10619.1 hypothetical protein THASP1DRAFT_27587 [Thamnocephalis sphaerospora]
MLASREELATAIGISWQKNATYFDTIPLHPLGEQSYLNFVNAGSDLEDMHARWRVSAMQTIITIYIFWLFAANYLASVRMTLARPRALAPWCCLLQSLAGIVCALFSPNAYTPSDISCREIIWMITICIRINDLCATSILLQKAYIVKNCSRWLFVFIPLTVIAPVPLLYTAWSSPVILSTISSGCVFIYPDYYPWLRFIFHAPLNFVLTTIFIEVAYSQHKRFGSYAWKQLAREGIQVGLQLLAVNLLCTLAISFEIVGVYSIALTLPEWCISSVLLVTHIDDISKIKPVKQEAVKAKMMQAGNCSGSDMAPLDYYVPWSTTL